MAICLLLKLVHLCWSIIKLSNGSVLRQSEIWGIGACGARGFVGLKE